MSRIERDFSLRPAEEQAMFLKHTWCNQCLAEDLGMHDPEEYEINGTVYITGKCTQCGDAVTTELQEED